MSRTPVVIPCSPLISGLTAIGMLRSRRRRYRKGILGWIRSRRDPNGWVFMPPTQSELYWYECHMSGGMVDRIDYNPEDWADDPGEKVVKLLTMYAEQEQQLLDDRPWWSKAKDAAQWVS